MQIAILLFDGTTHLDSVGPYEVLHNLPGADIAKAIQLGIEYDPQPPFDAGNDAGNFFEAPADRVAVWRAGLNKTQRPA